MNTTLTLMELAGAIALLIWGVHMGQTGITRAFGPQLRRILATRSAAGSKPSWRPGG
jgi:phosphate:Na+ symporter